MVIIQVGCSFPIVCVGFGCTRRKVFCGWGVFPGDWTYVDLCLV